MSVKRASTVSVIAMTNVLDMCTFLLRFGAISSEFVSPWFQIAVWSYQVSNLISHDVKISLDKVLDWLVWLQQDKIQIPS